jgi:hypothetical protein
VYKDVAISEENLDWIQHGCKQELPAQTIEEDNEVNLHKFKIDMGSSRNKIEDVLQTEEYTEEVPGTLQDNSPSASLSKHGHALCNDLNEACKQSKIPSMSRLNILTEAPSEYDKDYNLFMKAFPYGSFQEAVAMVST